MRLPVRPMFSLGPISAKGRAAGEKLQTELAEALGSNLEGAIVRLVVNDIPSPLYRSLDQNALRAQAEKAVHLELKFGIVQGNSSVQWRSTSLSSLDQEFESYLSQCPVEGADREQLRVRGLEYIRRGRGE